MTTRSWDIAVDAPLHQLLTYLEPEELSGKIYPGSLVEVPLQRRTVKGLVVQPHIKTSAGSESKGPPKLKSVSQLDAELPALSEPMIRWLKFLSEYYVYPLGRTLRGVFPPLKKSRRTRASHKSPVLPNVALDEKKNLTAEQAQALNDIKGDLNTFSTHLIFGVTGSGKTELYLQAIDEILTLNKQALVLVPEISLTPQLIERFTARFGNKVAVLHSQLTEREKTEQWWAAVEGPAEILIGARSALFCPLPRLGLIVVDEEHEASFKQEESLRYHARDAAIVRAKFENCPILLGSATPSLESWHKALAGDYRLHTLRERATRAQLPDIEILNLKADDVAGDGAWNDLRPSWMSPRLKDLLEETLSRGEQAALFLNRRGVAQAVVGRESGHVPECPNCDISLTLHGKNYLVCHYCNYSSSVDQEAKKLGESELTPLGLGTELIESDLQRLFPSARLARADRDEINTREELEEIIHKVERGDVDFLIGTQMISKGLDFPNLSLVALVLADVGFNMPDFRAVERSFQLITQVSGRAGRHEKPGRVLVQTLNPDHPCLSYVLHHDYEGFANFELSMRQALSYPPWGRLCVLRTLSLKQSEAEGVSLRLRQAAEGWLQNHDVQGVELLGPSPCPLSRIRNRYRHQLLIKSTEPLALRRLCYALFHYFQSLKAGGVQLQIDMDPQNLL